MSQNPATIFTKEWATAIFPPQRTDAFFDALFGDAEEGAYTISLRFVRAVDNCYEFVFDLHQRAGKCLACNLTYGLPQVFSRHPVINVKGVARAVATALEKDPESAKWDVKTTQEISTALHCVPLVVSFA